MADTADDIRFPRGSADHGSLRIANGVAGLEIVGDAEVDDLVRVWHGGAAPDVDATGGIVNMKYPGISAWPRHKGPIVVGLNPALPWAVDIDGGAEDTTVRLAGVRLSSFSVRGAKDLRLELGEPHGTATIALGKGVEGLVVGRPEGVAIRVYIKGGAKGLVLDHHELGAVGGPVKWETPDFESSQDRFEVHVDGGASDFTLEITG